MRYVTVRAEPVTGRGFHPLGSAIVNDPEVIPGPIHQIELVEGGTGISLSEIETTVRNVPSPRNPKTSYLAAVSAIEKVRGLDENVHVGT